SSAPGIGSTPEVSAKIVKKGEMSVQVQKGAIDSSIQQATDIAARYNGFVQSTSTFGADTGSVDLRVPVTKFEHAIAALARLGHVTSRQISGIDVTAHYVDLKGRLQIAEQQRTVLLKLLSHATSIEDTLRLQNALTPVQLNIEQLKGQIRLLATQAAQSTITVDFATPNAPAAVQRHAASAIHTPSFARGLKYAWAGFLDVVVAVLVGLGYLIPIGLVVFLVWLIVRRMRRPRTA
ncbi:MAG TPA: DUF4349 domain-containing protein, partial [Amycolatopsis sp.]|nr:DUF4349 domain-containing protein [Amycolatopsis sp.]